MLDSLSKIVMVVLFSACGSSSQFPETVKKKRLPHQQNPGESVEFISTLMPILMARCGACHQGASFLTDPSDYRSTGQPTVRNRSMPPNSALDDREYSILTSF